MFLDTAELISLNVDVTNNAAIFISMKRIYPSVSLGDVDIHVLKMIFKIGVDELFADREEDKAMIFLFSRKLTFGKTIGIYSLVDDAAKHPIT